MRIPVATNESLPYIVVLLIVDLTAMIINYFFKNIPGYFGVVVSLICLVFFIAIVFFFRDPERKIISDEGVILSPADGKIVSIAEEEDKEYIKGFVKKISIFLSIFDVHVQRAPITCKIEFVNHISGKFLSAWKDAAGMENYQNHIGISYNKGKILIKQIAGVLARKPVCYVHEKDEIKIGQRIGIIKFGSRVEILLPQNIEIRIKKGDKVKAGETVLAVVK